MQVRILKTDGGPHSAEAWALVTAEYIVDVDPNADATVQVAARNLETKIINALIAHHKAVEDSENAKLAAGGDDHLATDIVHDNTVEGALADVLACVVGTPWEAKFADPEMQGKIKYVLNDHFTTNSGVHRDWFIVKNPDGANAQAILATRSGE